MLARKSSMRANKALHTTPVNVAFFIEFQDSYRLAKGLLASWGACEL